MKSAVATLMAVVVLLASGATVQAKCRCSMAKIENGWCQDCKLGYVAGVRIESKKLYAALDGKPLADASKIKCPACKTAVHTDGACDHCQVGFVGKTAYASMPAYRLARGEPKDPAKIQCTACRAAASDRGWCSGCKAGLVGTRAFKDKQAYSEAVKARDTVRLAAKTARKCEACAVAMVTDGACASCKTSFKDGRKVSTAGNAGAKSVNP